MTKAVLDASAIIAFLRREPGSEFVRPYLRGSQISTVNYTEVLAKGAANGVDLVITEGIMNDLGIHRIPFSDNHAHATASLLPLTRDYALSLADRACLALGQLSNLPVVTADKDWLEVGLPVDIRLIR